MKIQQLKKEIKGVFKQPVKKYYFGKIKYGCPYFFPWNFNSTIISVRKLKLKTQEELNEYKERYKYSNKDNRFINLPMVRRCKNWIIKLFNHYYYIEIGFPIAIKNVELGWKEKWGLVRYEWSPQFHLFFFKWQFCVFWNSPDGNSDKYYEQILWYLKYCNKNIEKSKASWGWIDGETKKSTWNDDYLITTKN